jgi:hypothetical protein
MQFGHLFAKAPTREAAIRAMVVALRDVRVRGEIHTIIDYAADMLQSPEFVNNEIHTGWLDSRIAANVRAERPPWHLCVIGAAAVRAHEAFACKAAEYLGFLAKGQLPPHDVSLIYFEVGLPAYPITLQLGITARQLLPCTNTYQILKLPCYLLLTYCWTSCLQQCCMLLQGILLTGLLCAAVSHILPPPAGQHGH